MALGGLGLSGVLSGGLLWLSVQGRVTPYVVEVDRLGEVRAVEPATRDYRPTDPEIAWHLARFISDVRSVSLDPVLMRQNWLSAYDFVTARGAAFLSQYARGANPFGAIGTRTVSVQVTSVVRASDRSFEIKWTESEYDRGILAATSHWTGITSVVTKTPRDADTLMKNPLGLYVDAIDWSRELETNTPIAPRDGINPSVSTGVPAHGPTEPNLSTRSNS
jgi:type IV secretion system protein VirB5